MGPRAARLHEEIVPVTARWIDPVRRRSALAPYGRAGEQTTLASLRTALDEAGRDGVPDPVRSRLAASAQADIAALLPHLERRAAECAEQAKRRLAERLGVESRSMIELLRRQRKRIAEAAGKDERQMTIDFDDAERRQREADRRAWTRRLQAIEIELETEPARIADGYRVRAVRVDPLGLVYLWPAHRLIMADREHRNLILAHQEWLGFVQPVGVLVVPTVMVDAQVVPDRNVSGRQREFQALLPPSRPMQPRPRRRLGTPAEVSGGG